MLLLELAELVADCATANVATAEMRRVWASILTILVIMIIYKKS